MIQYDLNHSEYLSAAKHFYKVWETPSIKAEEQGRGREVVYSHWILGSIFTDARGRHLST